MIDLIAIELLHMVLELIDDKPSYAALCKVSRGLNKVVSPYLYRFVVINVREQWMADGNMAQFPAVPTENLRFTQHLAFKAPFKLRRHLSDRCYHSTAVEFSGRDYMSTDSPGESDDGSTSFDLDTSVRPVRKQFIDFIQMAEMTNQLEGMLMSFLLCLQDMNLQSFHWDVGICLPTGIIEKYMFSHQASIRELSIVPNSKCVDNTEKLSGLPSFSRFKALESFAFKGLMPNGDHRLFGELYASHGSHLKELDLDFLDWEAQNESLHDPDHRWCNPFVECIEDLLSDNREKILPALEQLSLKAVSFEDRASDIISFFNIANLRGLKLRHCHYPDELLIEFVRMLKPGAGHRKLENLEIVCGDADYLDHDLGSLVECLLVRFSGLQSFVFMASGNSSFCNAIDALDYHSETLERVVIHPFWEDEGDLSLANMTACLSRLPKLSFLGVFEKFDEIYGGLQIEFSNFQPNEERQHLFPSLQVLHIHAQDSKSSKAYGSLPSYSPTLSCLVQWAFSPHGFSNLEIMAYGDFNQGVYSPSNLLFCRRPFRVDQDETVPTFRRMRKTDYDLHRILNKNMNMLTACPVAEGPIVQQFGFDE